MSTPENYMTILAVLRSLYKSRPHDGCYDKNRGSIEGIAVRGCTRITPSLIDVHISSAEGLIVRYLHKCVSINGYLPAR